MYAYLVNNARVGHAESLYIAMRDPKLSFSARAKKTAKGSPPPSSRLEVCNVHIYIYVYIYICDASRPLHSHRGIPASRYAAPVHTSYTVVCVIIIGIHRQRYCSSSRNWCPCRDAPSGTTTRRRRARTGVVVSHCTSTHLLQTMRPNLIAPTPCTDCTCHLH